MTAKPLIGTEKCHQVLNFWFADKGTAKEFLKFLVTDNLQKHHIRIWDRDGNILLAEHGQLFLFANRKENKWKTRLIMYSLKNSKNTAAQDIPNFGAGKSNMSASKQSN